jgi:hypothetical protein
VQYTDFKVFIGLFWGRGAGGDATIGLQLL